MTLDSNQERNTHGRQVAKATITPQSLSTTNWNECHTVLRHLRPYWQMARCRQRTNGLNWRSCYTHLECVYSRPQSKYDNMMRISRVLRCVDRTSATKLSAIESVDMHLTVLSSRMASKRKEATEPATAMMTALRYSVIAIDFYPSLKN